MYLKQAALQQYQKISTDSEAQGASPHRLVQMLMSGAMDRMNQAKTALQDNDVAAKGELLGKTVSIIAGLQSSLNAEQGGELAINLDRLYEYMQRRLLEANINNDIAAIDEVSSLLLTVKTSWDHISPGYG